MHQAVNVFALSFLLLIGRTGRRRFGMHIPKGYIYFAIRFSVLAEMVNRPSICLLRRLSLLTVRDCVLSKHLSSQKFVGGGKTLDAIIPASLSGCANAALEALRALCCLR